MSDKKSNPALLAAFPHGLKGLIFDCDGVIFDSRESNTSYYNAIRKGVGLPPLTHEDIAYVHMSTVHAAFARLFPPPYDQAALEYSSLYDYKENIVPMLVPEHGILELLHWLQNWHIKIGMCTNRTNTVSDVLRYFSLEGFFWPVKTAANSFPKPRPEGLWEIIDDWKVPIDSVAFIGDSQVDEEAARAAGMNFWAFKNQNLNADLHIKDFFAMMEEIACLVEHD